MKSTDPISTHTYSAQNTTYTQISPPTRNLHITIHDFAHTLTHVLHATTFPTFYDSNPHSNFIVNAHTKLNSKTETRKTISYKIHMSKSHNTHFIIDLLEQQNPEQRFYNQI